MRHSPIAFSTLRTAIEDVDSRGMIPAAHWSSPTRCANRDPAVYDDRRLDITRDGVRRC